MSPIEIIALIFALAIILKLVFFWFLFKPKFVMKIIDSVFKKTILMSVIFMGIAVVLLYFLTAELNVMQIVSAALFGMMVFGLMIIQYPNAYKKLAEDVMKHKEKAILPWIIFVLLAVWVLYAMFA